MSSRKKRRNIEPVSCGPISRIALTTGTVSTIGKKSCAAVKLKIKAFLDTVVRDSLTFTEHARRRTVMDKDVENALEGAPVSHKKILGEPPTKACKIYSSRSRKSRSASSSRKIRVKRSTNLIRKIVFYQKQSDCLYLPKQPVNDLIREIAQEYKHHVRFSADALNLIRYALELYLANILKAAGLLSIHRGNRGGVKEKDLKTLEALEFLF